MRLSYSQRLAALSRLTSQAAHEIRNRLNAIVLQVALLRKKHGDPQQDSGRHLDVLEKEVMELGRMIQGLVDFIRPREETQLEGMRLEKVVEETLDLMAPRAEQCGIRIESRIASELPAVSGNAELLREALQNLVTNAFEAMPEGGVLRIRADRSAEDSVLLTVEDTGEGIAAEDLPKVFDLFHTTRGHRGGVGLSAVYRTILLHGGEVGIDSERGTGTRVRIVLPVMTAPHRTSQVSPE